MKGIQRRHYFLVAATVVFLVPETGEQIHQATLNAVFQNDDGKIRSRDVAKAQQVAQLHLAKKLDGQEFNPVDVVINGITYMGLMSDEEFAEEPVGVAKQERPQATAQVLQGAWPFPSGNKQDEASGD